ncbi:S-adenosylmethionine decarboxylase [Natranaerovirga pectinivora]|uniref:S-adenosylmethionine decarboxylase proenzyme n=1 Tax=Natranaerovirga pectinivora TaxID=682400 RepID=A0A4R3MSP1_9FIRM|nr:adenosylmethionine decarboxylase [Natranaerovirga pectinivora]TCT16710.1 S-adenosylmethionine decarboxylase [Natranaerovirga pectinivora]
MNNNPSKLELHGFNNLTKTLSFNIYDICYTSSAEDRKRYIDYIDEQYNSERLTEILKNVTNMIGASVLNVSKQDYDPQGASVTILISEEEVPLYCIDSSCNRGILTPIPQHIAGHLDKSHLTVHTYPESHPVHGINTFRVDIDVSTCGQISPLNALNYLIESFESDILALDYRVRGFTRDKDGTKHFIDHNIGSIQDYIDKDISKRYNLVDTNMLQQNIFHTKMMVNDFKLNDYLFEIKEEDLSKEEALELRKLVYNEMLEIFYGTNFEYKY